MRLALVKEIKRLRTENTELRVALEKVCNAFESIVPSSQSGTLLKREVLARVAHIRKEKENDDPQSPALDQA